jgi:hypothetical protein
MIKANVPPSPFPPSPKIFLNILETTFYNVDNCRLESSFQINISQVQFFSHFK